MLQWLLSLSPPRCLCPSSAPIQQPVLYLIQAARQQLLLKHHEEKSTGHSSLSISVSERRKTNSSQLVKTKPFLLQCIAWKAWGQPTQESYSCLKMQLSPPELELTWPGVNNLFLPSEGQHHPKLTETCIITWALMWTKDSQSRSHQALAIHAIRTILINSSSVRFCQHLSHSYH